MFEELKKKYPLLYSQLNEYILTDHISHAYLIDVGDNDNYMEFIKAFAIAVLDKNNHNPDVNYEKMINNGSFSDFLIVSPSNSRWIKKDQIIQLQTKYKTKSIYENRKIYVIDKADDLNISSSNTLLKFLEEPNDDVVAILITRNKYNVIPTVVSRCQFIKMDQLQNNSNDIIQEKVLEFLSLVFKYESDSFPFIKKIDYDFDNREKITVFVEEILKFYQDLLRVILKRSLLYYNNYEKQLDKIAGSMNIRNLCDCILALNDLYDELEYNVNCRLFIDKLIMVIIGVDMSE